MNGDRFYAGWKEETDRILKQHDHAFGNGHPPKERTVEFKPLIPTKKRKSELKIRLWERH